MLNPLVPNSIQVETNPELQQKLFLYALSRLQPAEATAFTFNSGFQDLGAIKTLSRIFEQNISTLDRHARVGMHQSLHSLNEFDARTASSATIGRFIANQTAPYNEALTELFELGAFATLVLWADQDAFPLPPGFVERFINSDKMSLDLLNDCLEKLSFTIHLENGINFQRLMIVEQDKKFLLAGLQSALTTPSLTRDKIKSIQGGFDIAFREQSFQSRFTETNVPLIVITHGRPESIINIKEHIKNLHKFGHTGKTLIPIYLLNDCPGLVDSELRESCKSISALESEVSLRYIGIIEREKMINEAATIVADGGSAEVSRLALDSFIGPGTGAGGNRNLAALISGGRNYIVIDDDVSFTVPTVTSQGTQFDVDVNFYSVCQRSLHRPGIIASSYQYAGHVDTETQVLLARSIVSSVFKSNKGDNLSSTIQYGENRKAGKYSRDDRAIYDYCGRSYIHGGVYSFAGEQRGLLGRLPTFVTNGLIGRNQDCFTFILPVALHFPKICNDQEPLSNACHCCYQAGAAYHKRAEGGRPATMGLAIMQESMCQAFTAIIQVISSELIKAGDVISHDFSDKNVERLFVKLGQRCLAIAEAKSRADLFTAFPQADHLTNIFIEQHLSHLCFFCTDGLEGLAKLNLAPSLELQNIHSNLLSLVNEIHLHFGIWPNQFKGKEFGYPDQYKGGGFPRTIYESGTMKLFDLIRPSLKAYANTLIYWRQASMAFDQKPDL